MDATEAAARLEELNRGFRQDYLPYDELTAQVHDWAEAFPELVRVQSIGETPDGRSLWLLVIGPEPERVRPAVWIDGNMHASELCGSSVALAIAEDILSLHLDAERSDMPALPASVADNLGDVLFYILPRMSPDGAETILQTGRYVRSMERDDRPNRNHPYWRQQDVDHDGTCLQMRIRDPGGEFVEAPEVPGLLVARRIGDPGPYYKLYPEGIIENFDGRTIPAPWFLSDNRVDLNRNFPWSWAPEHEQMGAGAYPTSEPESRAVVEFTSSRPHIFAWLNLHTFGGVFIRPLGHRPDNQMDPSDLALYHQIGQWAEAFTGYPMVSGFEEFTYEPDKPLRGDLTDYAYHQRGCIAYVVELWDLFAQLGFGPDCKRFVDRYMRFGREQMVDLARWDAEHNFGRVVRGWTAYDHPQLGPVEIGGIDRRVGVSNPPYEKLPEICTQHSLAFLHVAALAPSLVFADVTVTEEAPDLHRITAVVQNRGYLPTHILSSAKKLGLSEPIHAVLATEECTLDPGCLQRQELGHLSGWGRGLHNGFSQVVYGASQGNSHQRTLSYLVRGTGTATLRVGSCRTGYIERVMQLGQ